MLAQTLVCYTRNINDEKLCNLFGRLTGIAGMEKDGMIEVGICESKRTLKRL